MSIIKKTKQNKISSTTSKKRVMKLLMQSLSVVAQVVGQPNAVVASRRQSSNQIRLNTLSQIKRKHEDIDILENHNPKILLFKTNVKNRYEPPCIPECECEIQEVRE